MDRCLEEIKETGANMIQALKSNDELKMALLMSMQQTMQKLVEKL
jgi:hypothetical protein